MLIPSPIHKTAIISRLNTVTICIINFHKAPVDLTLTKVNTRNNILNRRLHNIQIIQRRRTAKTKEVVRTRNLGLGKLLNFVKKVIIGYSKWFRYQSANVPASTPSSPAVAHGVVQHQRPRAQPLPRVFTSSAPNTELAPLATASPTFPPPQPVLQPAPQQPQIQQQTFTNYPQTQGNFFYPPVPPQYNNEGQPQFQQPPQQPPTNVNPNYYNSYSNSTSQQQYREPPVVNYTFKEGTPPY